MKSRSSFRGQSGSGNVSGRWTMISLEELFTGRPPARTAAEEQGERGLFAQLLKMTRSYQVTDEGRRDAFLEQARMMEHYEEEGDISPDFYHAYVGYQEMNARELHGYFSWRTAYRRGESVPFCAGYVQLHAAELVNLIGAEDKADAFDRLLRLMQAGQRKDAGDRAGQARDAGHSAGSGMIKTARGVFPDVMRRMDKILSDFVIAWGPAEEIVQAYCISDTDMEREIQNTTLCHVAQSSDAAVYRVIGQIAERRSLNSQFMEQSGEDAQRVVARVFRRLCGEQKRSGAPVLSERLLGKRIARPRPLFAFVPYENHIADGYSIDISPATSYFFRDGMWYRSAYPAMRSDDALRDLNTLIRECERVLRKKMRFRNQLPDRMKDPALERLIGEEIDRWMKEKALRSRPEVHVDLSKLGTIRDLAAITRERLLEGTEEGAEADFLMQSEMPAPDSRYESDAINQPGEAEAADQQGSAEVNRHQSETQQGYADVNRRQSEMQQGGLDVIGQAGEAEAEAAGQPEDSDACFSRQEAELLRMLLDGEDGKAFFRRHKVLPSVFVDAINEKAYDAIGDSIVWEDGSGWCLAEDYIEEVRELLGE